MVRIAVCDDVPAFVEILSERIWSWANSRHQNVQLKKFFSGEELLIDMEENGDFWTVFLDIELGGMNGIKTAQRIRENQYLTSIIFVTQHRGYHRCGYRFYPYQYLEKPVPQSQVYEALDVLMGNNKCLRETYSFVYNRIAFRIVLQDILYIVSEGRTVHICMRDGKEYMQYERLDVLEALLAEFNERFVRIHQSYLVNVKWIEEFHHKYVRLYTSELLPVSRSRRKMLERFHLETLRKEFVNL